MGGHKRTIRPNAKKLSSVFRAHHEMDWETFSRKVKSCQKGFMGEPEEMRPGRGDFHEFPYACICRKPYIVGEEYISNIDRLAEQDVDRIGVLVSDNSDDNEGEDSLHRLNKQSLGGDLSSPDGDRDDEFFPFMNHG